MNKRARDPLPGGWRDDLMRKADLERSFDELEGRRGFYAEALRGRIRSLQMHTQEAWQHLERAQQKALRAQDDLNSLTRQFTLNLWCFEHALLESSPEPEGDGVPETRFPEPPGGLLEHYPQVRAVMTLRRYSEAMLRLHLGDWMDAAALFEELIENERANLDGNLPYYYLGLAACHHGAEVEDLAFRNLEDAGLTAAASGSTLRQARVAGALHGIYHLLSEDRRADGWKAFLERLPCPEATKKVFLRRGSLIGERSREQGWLVVL